MRCFLWRRTSERSSTMIRAFPCEVTASRNLSAASLRTTLSSHSTTAMSPIFSICTLSMTSSMSCPLALRARAVPSNCSLHFVLGKRPSSRGTGSFGKVIEKICATTNAVFLEEAERYSPKKQQEPMRPSGNPSTADRDKLPTCGRDLISQVNERVALLSLAESYTNVVFRNVCRQ